MKLLLLSIVTMLAANASGQMQDDNTGPDNSSTPTTSMGDTTVHQITVGHVMNSFQPNSIQAKPGDIVQFMFHGSNHSVVKAAYGYPCVPYETIFQDQPGFYSGLMTLNDTAMMPTWQITINDTNPIFFYGGGPAKCSNYGMVGVINANNNTDLTKQIALAKSEKYQLSPGQTLPQAAAVSLAAIAATATAAASSSTSTDHSTSGTNSLSTSIIAAVAVVAFVLIVAAALLFFFLGRAHGRRNSKTEWHPEVQSPVSSGANQTSRSASPFVHRVVSPVESAPLPQPYASNEAKTPYVEHKIQYMGVQQPGSPHIVYTQHSGFVDHGAPRPLLPLASIEESELDGGSVHASRTSPGYGRVQELDAQPQQYHHNYRPDQKQDYF